MDATWRSRIVGHGEENPDQLLANPANWRIHPKAQQAALSSVLSEVGWVQSGIVNQRTGNLVDGHLRVSLALQNNEPSIPVAYVDLSADEEALVLATIDPIGAMAAKDEEKLAELITGLSSGNQDLNSFLEGLAPAAESSSNPYTDKIEIPQYEITGEQVDLSELVDRTKVNTLVGKIKQSSVPSDVKEFLLLAATRHAKFNYRKIAEYYAASDAPTQRLMEESALVIIDFEDAAQQGFVELSKNLERIFGLDDA